MDEEKIKGRTWNGYVCPGCRTVFRVAADFGGSEVMCPSCNGTLRLPKTPEEVQPHTVRPVQLPADGAVETAKPSKPTKPARTADLKHENNGPSALQTLLATSDGRLKLTLALLLPLALLAGALVVFPPEEFNSDKTIDASAPLFRPENEVAEKPAPPPPPVAVNEMPVADETPALPEVVVAEPVPEMIPESVPKPAPEPVVEVTPPPVPEPRPPVATVTEDLVPALPAVSQTAPEKPAPVPAAPPPPNPEPTPTAAPVEIVHTVSRGDTLTKISRKYQVGIATIKKANAMKGDAVMLGQKLKIPGGITPVAEKTVPPTVVETPASAQQAGRSHTVVRGDTLERIARKYGVEPSAIMQANGMKNDVVHLGRKLVIPAAP